MSVLHAHSERIRNISSSHPVKAGRSRSGGVLGPFTSSCHGKNRDLNDDVPNLRHHELSIRLVKYTTIV